VERLNGLVLRAHQRIHGARAGLTGHWIQYALRTFPQLVRAEWRLVLLSTLLFYGPMAGMMLAIRVRPAAAYLVLNPTEIARMEDMYDPAAQKIGPARHSDTDLMMFGHYIRNNVSIDFQCFATGLFFGLGSAFLLAFNGLVIGTVAGHLTHAGYGSTFWPFVSGHSALELTAAVLSGAAGLRMGVGLLLPGRMKRLESLKAAARRGMRLLYGAAFMTFTAAFIEAFWSSTTAIPAHTKYGVGITLWTLLLFYFLALGHGRNDETAAMRRE
jgi:uncharacterized membrane protein SpoIIM required for sporulation